MWVFCRGFGYNLRGLPSGACPECGREFDPGSLADGRGAAKARIGWRISLSAFLVPACWPLLTAGWIHLMYVVARLRLGSWPQIYVDDPKYISLVQEMHIVGWLMMMFFPVTLILMVVAWVQMFWIRRRAALVLAPLGVGLWVVMLAIALWDPFGAARWFWD